MRIGYEGNAGGVAASVLAVLAVLSPWPFGAVLPHTTQAIAVFALLAAAFVAFRGRDALVEAVRCCPTWLLAALFMFALVQLLPLPAGVHRAVAPGSAAIWHPADPVAAGVLGDGPHPLSIHPAATRRWLVFALAVSALALAVAPALRRRTSALRLTLVLVAGGLTVALYGLVARVAFGDRLYGVFAVPTVAPFGPFVSKNHFAGYVEGLALLAMGLTLGLADHAGRSSGALGWIDGARASRVVWAAGAAAGLGLAVAVSLSRGGVFALTMGVVVLIVMRWMVRHRKESLLRGLVRYAAALAVVAALGFGLLPDEARERLRGIGSAGDEVSGSYRLDVWRDTLGLAATSPVLGHGFGAFEDALPRVKTAAGELQVEHAENDWLELVVEGGALALVLVLLLAGLTVRRFVQGLRAQGDRVLRGIGLGALAGAMALAAHSLVDFNLRIPSNALVFAGLVALAAAAARPLQKEGGMTGASPPPRLSPAVTTVLLLALVAALILPWASEERAEPDGLRLAAVRPGAPLRRTAAEESLSRHLRSRPADARAWASLAWVRFQRDAAEARALAAHALWLDPLNPGLRESLRWAARRAAPLPAPSAEP